MNSCTEIYGSCRHKSKFHRYQKKNHKETRPDELMNSEKEKMVEQHTYVHTMHVHTIKLLMPLKNFENLRKMKCEIILFYSLILSRKQTVYFIFSMHLTLTFYLSEKSEFLISLDHFLVD